MATGQLLAECRLTRIWSQLDATAGTLEARRRECEEFNAERGLAMVPTCYGVNFSLRYLNQALSYVLVYTDGSVLLTHGGTEMGQGLNTKVIQVAEASPPRGPACAPRPLDASHAIAIDRA